MKRIISVSIGSSSRDHQVETEILGEKYLIERIGTDGSIKKAIELIKTLDGQVEAMGLGGIDLYLSGAHKNFMIREARHIVASAQKTPIVDGTGLKNTLERKIIDDLHANKIIDFKEKKVLIVCAIDRFQMAQGFIDAGCELVIGDLIFALGVPIPIKSMRVFKRIVSFLLPVVACLPFNILYPTGEKQTHKKNKALKLTDHEKNTSNFEKYYHQADIIAGDFLYIKKYLPQTITDKIIITNTVTQRDIQVLKARGAKMLITSTPAFTGRSFGTNVMEAVLVAVSGKRPEQLSVNDYLYLIKKMNLMPRIEYLNAETEHAHQ